MEEGSLRPASRFGGPINAARSVTQYAKAGVVRLHIQTKRCGYLMGKQIVSREEFLARIRAAVIARDLIPGGSDSVWTRANFTNLIDMLIFLL
jgi:2-methylisocitrate lyase-like PEP mutase family enzyme